MEVGTTGAPPGVGAIPGAGSDVGEAVGEGEAPRLAAGGGLGVEGGGKVGKPAGWITGTSRT